MNNFFRWGMILALLVIVGCGVIAVRIVFVEDSDVTVPSLVGMSMTDAAVSLQQVGLLAKVDQVDSSQPTGTVISQHIEAGQRVGKGKVVLIKVSKGGERIPVPDVRGLEFGEAVRTLDQAGFKAGAVLRVTDSLKPAGSVIAQNPAAPALVGGNRAIQLLVCEGNTGQTGGMLFVPDLRGQTVALAGDILTQTGLSLDKIITLPSDAVPEGTVIASIPRSGARIPSGGVITLHVAKAPLPSANAGDEPISLGEPKPVEPKPVEPKPTPQAESKPDPKPIPKPEAKPVVTQQETKPVEARKVAKIRYQVPPLTKPLSLKIEIVDVNGTRTLKDTQTGGSEYITLDAPYAGEARVLIHLGGDFVWQDRFE